MLSSRREAFLPCPLPASRSTTSFSQPPPDCFVLLGPGDPGGGGRVQSRQLPGLRRPFPDWRPGATCSATTLSKSLKMESFFAAASPWVQRLQAARLPPRLPRGLACKVQNLLTVLIPHSSSSHCSGTALAPCAGRPLQLGRRRRWVTKEGTRVRRASE